MSPPRIRSICTPAALPFLPALRRAIRALANPADAVFLQRFFRTGPGEYGAGDQFLGIRVPAIRRLARDYRALPLGDAVRLLQSPWHEERLCALILMVERHRRGDGAERARVRRAYLANARRINNWDLVDVSAPQVAGEPEDLELWERLAASPLLWERRIAMLATFAEIRRGRLGPAFAIAERLLGDPHDLMHKAVGWMLREAGKRDRAALEAFLERHGARMPRTALRYAIERFPEPDRQRYLRRDRAPQPAAGRRRSVPA